MTVDLNPGEIQSIRDIFDILRDNVKHLHQYHGTIENLMSIRNKIHSKPKESSVPLTYKDQVIGEATLNYDSNKINCKVTTDEGKKIIEELMKPTPIGISSRKLDMNDVYEPVRERINPIENILNVCRVLYPEYKMDIYDEPWSQGYEFITFRLNTAYIGRIHTYQLCDIIKQDLLKGNDKNLRDALN